MHRQPKSNRFRETLLTVGLIAFGASIAVVMALITGRPVQVHLPPQAAPVAESDVPALCGWAGKQAADDAWRQIGATFPKFKIVGADEDNARKNVRLWDATKAVNGGKHLPTRRQLIGSCVGHSTSQAVDYLQCIAIAAGEFNEFKPTYTPYHYATGRNAPECGRGQIRGPDGSVGSWQAKALTLYGCIPSDIQGLQSEDNRSVIVQWATRMPTQQWLAEGRKHLVRSAARIWNADEARDALCNGYPLILASNWGGQMRPQTKDGRLVNRRVTTWPHQMAAVAYDGGTGSEPYFCILNSWGEDAHGAPPDDSQPGSFWINKREMDWICKDGEVFALSQFDGFPAQDWLIIRDRLSQRALRDRFNRVASVERN